MGKKSNTFGFRLLQLFVLLSSADHSYSLTRLAQIFGCSRQSILRMVEQLELLPNINLESFKKSKERHYQIRTRHTTPLLSLDANILRNLIMCRDIVRHILPEPMHEEIGYALQKIAGDDESGLGQIPPQSITDAFWKGRIDYTPHQKTLQGLIKAIDDGVLCRIMYRSSATEPAKLLHARPLRLLAFHEALYARCMNCDAHGLLMNEAPMTLAVHRINDITLSHRVVPAPAPAAEPPLFGFRFNEPFEVRIRFSPAAATYVSERRWSADQHCTILADGGIELRFSSTSRPEVKSWVMSFGDTAELIEPVDLRQELIETLTETLSAYSEEP